MGLDMYLMRQRSAGYWRKANAIHKWMIENICNKNYEFNCEDADLPLEKAKELLSLCKRILSAHQNGEDWQTIAEEHLPSQDRFFYVATDWVCSNTALGGETVVKRRHTANVELERLVFQSVETLENAFITLEQGAQWLKGERLSEDEARLEIV